MADSTITLTVKKSWLDKGGYHVRGTLAIGASPGTYTTNGITCNLASSDVKAQRAPISVKITGRALSNAQTQYDYTFIPGTDVTNGKLKIFTGGAEITGAPTAMPAGVSGDTLDFEGDWAGML